MTPYTIQGEVTEVGEVKEFAKSKKRELGLAVENGKYTDFLKFEFWNDLTDSLDNVAVGKKVEVEFYLSGRKGEGKWEGKTFMSLKGVNFSFLMGSEPVTQEVIDAGDEAQAKADDTGTEILPF